MLIELGVLANLYEPKLERGVGETDPNRLDREFFQAFMAGNHTALLDMVDGIRHVFDHGSGSRDRFVRAYISNGDYLAGKAGEAKGPESGRLFGLADRMFECAAAIDPDCGRCTPVRPVRDPAGRKKKLA